MVLGLGDGAGGGEAGGVGGWGGGGNFSSGMDGLYYSSTKQIGTYDDHQSQTKN